MIEIKKDKNSTDKYQLFIAGKKVDEVNITKRPIPEWKYFDISTADVSVGKYLLSQKWIGFPPLESIRIDNWLKWEDFNIGILLGVDDFENNYLGGIVFFFKADFREWKKGFSFSEYEKVFNEKWKLIRGDASVTFYSSDEVEFEIDFKVDLSSINLLEKVTNYENLIKKCHEEVEKELLKDTHRNSLHSSFNFPNELKISCEQYLLYFAQFLRDLGINATSDLKEDAGKVLFSVTPTDDIEALDRIREALAVYLNLPSSPVLYNDSFQSMQLKQQVENLQHSQRMKEMEMRSAQYALRLAQQNIENQDKIIVQQNSFIDNQNKIIEKIASKSIMVDSLENKEELEKFCEGFEVGKSEFLIKHFGLHLNPATVLKNAGKRILGKEESKSVLGLDEENN